MTGSIFPSPPFLMTAELTVEPGGRDQQTPGKHGNIPLRREVRR